MPVHPLMTENGWPAAGSLMSKPMQGDVLAAHEAHAAGEDGGEVAVVGADGDGRAGRAADDGVVGGMHGAPVAAVDVVQAGVGARAHPHGVAGLGMVVDRAVQGREGGPDGPRIGVIAVRRHIPSVAKARYSSTATSGTIRVPNTPCSRPFPPRGT